MIKTLLKTPLKVIGVLFLIFLVYELTLWLIWDKDPLYAEKDMCFDLGGCWDAIDNLCRQHELNAQELCDRSSEK